MQKKRTASVAASIGTALVLVIFLTPASQGLGYAQFAYAVSQTQASCPNFPDLQTLIADTLSAYMPQPHQNTSSYWGYSYSHIDSFSIKGLSANLTYLLFASADVKFSTHNGEYYNKSGIRTLSYSNNYTYVIHMTGFMAMETPQTITVTVNSASGTMTQTTISAGTTLPTYTYYLSVHDVSFRVACTASSPISGGSTQS